MTLNFKSGKDNGYNKRYIQSYKGIPLQIGGVSAISWYPKDLGKPSELTIQIARNLKFEYPEKTFPYDSLYVQLTDTIRKFPVKDKNGNVFNLTFGENFNIWRISENDTSNYLKNYPINKYSRGKYARKYSIKKVDNIFYLSTYILTQSSFKLGMTYFFDVETLKIIYSNNRINSHP